MVISKTVTKKNKYKDSRLNNKPFRVRIRLVEITSNLAPPCGVSVSRLTKQTILCEFESDRVYHNSDLVLN